MNNTGEKVMLDLKLTSDDKESCNGIIYKADVQHCSTARGVLFSIRLNKMKRLSCPGCKQCGFIEDDLGMVSLIWPIIGIEKAEHNKLYALVPCNESRDYESGYIDSWDLKLVGYDEETKENSSQNPSSKEA